MNIQKSSLQFKNSLSVRKITRCIVLPSGGNSDSIGICFEGDYDVERTMPDAQKKAGKELVYHRKTSLRWKIRVATHQKWLTRDARVGTLAKGVNLLGNKWKSIMEYHQSFLTGGIFVGGEIMAQDNQMFIVRINAYGTICMSR